MSGLAALAPGGELLGQGCELLAPGDVLLAQGGVLLADGWGDLIGGGATLAVFVLWVILQAVWKSITNPQPPGKPRPPGAARPRPGQPPPPQGQAPDPLAELQAFLRRAQQLAQGGPAAEAQRPAGGPPPVPGQKQRKPKKRPAGTQTPGQPAPLEEGPRRGPRQPLGAEVRQHVREHLDSDPVGRRAKPLSQVDQAGQRLEAQIHKALDHSVSRLVGEMPSLTATAATATGPPPVAAELLALGLSESLHDPARLRIAIVMQEVLRRPEERWSSAAPPPASRR